LTNAFNPSFPNEIRANSTGFSEIIFGSNGDNPLPVTLNGFTGSGENGKVNLSWQTISESNNAGFILLRDGNEIASYNSFIALRGRGTTSEQTRYAFEDKSVEIGKSYAYQLRSVDLDGAIHDYPDAVSVEVKSVAELPKQFALLQNYPNPFNPTTTIRYDLPSASEVSLKVFDLLGREVATLVNARRAAGAQVVQFNAASFASGIYFYRLETASFSQTKKMLLAK
jgi:hypothetical protein